VAATSHFHKRERLYAAGVLTGPSWHPTTDPHLNALLRGWAFTERAERGATARAAGGTEVSQLSDESRRQRRGALPSPAPTTAPRAPFDPEAAWDAIRRAAERLAAAEAAALETNARVAQSVRDLFG